MVGGAKSIDPIWFSYIFGSGRTLAPLIIKQLNIRDKKLSSHYFLVYDSLSTPASNFTTTYIDHASLLNSKLVKT